MKKNYLLLAGLLSMGLFSACSSSSDDVASVAQKGEPATLKVMLTAGTTSTVAGRGAVNDIPDDKGSTIDGTIHPEANIKSLCVGIFNNTGNTVTIYQVPEADIAYFQSGTNYTVTGTEGTYAQYEKKIVTTTAGTDVIVVANAPQTFFASTLKTKTEFLQAAAQLNWTSAAGGAAVGDQLNNAGGQSSFNLPMIGEVTPVSYTNNEGTAEINLSRIVARVSLDKVLTDFSGSYANASFTPLEVYVAGTSTASYWDLSGGFDFAATALSSELNTAYTHEVTVTDAALTRTLVTDPFVATGKTFSNNGTLDKYAYLSSGIIGTAPVGASAQATGKQDASILPSKYVFYVMPNVDKNGAIQTNAGANRQIKLVIKGLWRPDVNKDYTEVRYYPIVINHWNINTTLKRGTTSVTAADATADDYVKANYAYKIGTVTLKGLGSVDPNTPIDPVNLTIKLTVMPWTGTVDQDVIFN